MRKEQGGMGFHNLQAFNLAMPTKHGWNFIFNLLDIVNEMDDIHWIILWISVIRS